MLHTTVKANVHHLDNTEWHAVPWNIEQKQDRFDAESSQKPDFSTILGLSCHLYPLAVLCIPLSSLRRLLHKTPTSFVNVDTSTSIHRSANFFPMFPIREPLEPVRPQLFSPFTDPSPAYIASFSTHRAK
ncbi:hypothetical protein HGRIS_001878 [Hohenbuehelia grisea]|uniref:Uncharacterized protein n=1 Tax=Hohenbuehelia grisea TaxID=104357 RepID=A0ABR3JJR5_9AGAR